MKYSFKDIVLVPFPFKDNLTETKQRPALIVGVCRYNRSYIAVKITSTIGKNSEVSYVLSNSDVTVPLKGSCEVSTDAVFSFDESIIIKKITAMRRDSFDRVKGMILSNFEE